MTISEALIWSKQVIFDSENGHLESMILLGYLLDLNTAELIAYGERKLSATQIARYKKIVSQRQKGVPIAYLTGIREFWSLPIMVNEQVLIPRHETETLVECVLALIDRAHSKVDILELGSGSGAIALALASELPTARISAVDNSVSALALARDNQSALGFNNIEFLQSDWFENLNGKKEYQKYHLICSNPPYLCADDKHLNIGDVRFEPKDALIADNGGYAAIEHIARHAKTHLHAGGWLVLEHGFQQGKGVRKHLSEQGYDGISTAQDLSGNERVTTARLN